MRTGQVAHTLRLPGPVRGNFALCRRGRMVAVPHETDEGMVIGVYEMSSGQARRVFPVRSDVTALAFSPDGLLLASGHANGTALLWDLSASEGAGCATPAELFERLQGEDAGAAWQAMLALVRTPSRAVGLARDHLRSHRAAPTPAEIDRLIVQLDHDNLRMRERAQDRLELHRRTAEAALKKAVAGKPSPEARRRLKQLLDGLPPLYPRALIPPLRALELLEMVGTPEAKAVLEEVAAWEAAPGLSAEAKAALARMKKGGGR